MIVEQVIHFAPIDLIHSNGNCKISFMLLEVSNSSVKKVSDG